MKYFLPLLLALFCQMNSSVAAEDVLSAPLFTAPLQDINGQPVTLEKFRGKPLLINFWARWCAPCRAEIPELASFRARYKAQGVEVIAIGIEDDVAAVRQFAKANKMDFPVFLAGDKGIPLMQALGNRRGGLPYTLVLDRQGKVLASRLGVMRQADLEAAGVAMLK